MSAKTENQLKNSAIMRSYSSENDTERVIQLTKAKRGDRKAFSRLMEPYRRELIAYCYRHTGSLTEAEDLTQEAFVRAYKALESFEGRASTRAWLYRIAHNLCLNHIQRSHSGWESLTDLPEERVAPTDHQADTPANEREDVRLSFVALMRSLPPRQRAVLVLRDVLGWSAEETAKILETTIPAVKNALARARDTLATHPLGADPMNVQDLAANSSEARAIVAEWVDAFEKGNTERMVALLTDVDSGSRVGLTRNNGLTKKHEVIPNDYISNGEYGKQSDKYPSGNAIRKLKKGIET